MTPLKLTSVLFATAVFTSCTKSVDLNPALESATGVSEIAIPNSNRPAFVPNEVIVKFKDGSSARGRESAFDLIGGTIKEQVLTPAMEAKGEDLGIFLVQTPMSVEQAIVVLKADDRVEYVGPNHLFYPSATPNDSLIGQQWGVNASSVVASKAVNAWFNNIVGSSTVYVGLLDEGVMYTHEDLVGNVKNDKEIAGDRKDNDGNGVIDDTYGWDFVNNDNQVFDGAADDHGTHVAGIIGAIGGNSKGIAGMNWNIRMINAKFIGSTGGTEINAIKAMDYMWNLKVKAKIPIVAVNCSWNAPGVLTVTTPSQTLQDAVNRLQAADILLVASVGNNGAYFDISKKYPAGFDNANIIRVTAVAPSGTLSANANYGASYVDIGAPGTDIVSTIPVVVKSKAVSSYGKFTGTSQAAAFVTGAVALYKSKYPSATGAEIKAAILSKATQNAGLKGYCGYNGLTLDVSGF